MFPIPVVCVQTLLTGMLSLLALRKSRERGALCRDLSAPGDVKVCRLNERQQFPLMVWWVRLGDLTKLRKTVVWGW